MHTALFLCWKYLDNFCLSVLFGNKKEKKLEAIINKVWYHKIYFLKNFPPGLLYRTHFLLLRNFNSGFEVKDL